MQAKIQTPLHNQEHPAFEGLLTTAMRINTADIREVLPAFRAAAPLPDDAQRLFDRTVIGVGRDRLALADAIISRGLVYNLPNWLAVPTLYTEQIGDVANARVVMDPSDRMDTSLPRREGVTIPIPAIVSDFNFGQRALLASQRSGAPLDVTMFEQATRVVNEQIEDLFINGWDSTYLGNSLTGLLNATNANTNAYVDSEAWDASGHSGADILADVQAMAATLKTDKFYGPYVLFIPTDYENKLSEDYSTSYPNVTIRDRLLMLPYLSDIVTADQLPDDRTALVQMTSNVVQAVVGQTPAQVSWTGGHPNGPRSFAVIACVLPRFRNTIDDTSGICTGNTS